LNFIDFDILIKCSKVRVIIFKLFLSLAVAFNCHSFKVHCINRASLTEPVLNRLQFNSSWEHCQIFAGLNLKESRV